MGLTRISATQISNSDYKQSVRVVTTTNITLAGGAPNTVDSVGLATNDRILVAGQSTGSQNGLYYVQTVGSGSTGTWVRTTDANTTGQISDGMLVTVGQGTNYADTVWELTTNDPITIDTTSLTFIQTDGSNSIKSGNSNVSVTTNGNVTISSAGTANVFVISSTGGYIAGTLSATGNITGNYILGNGSQLTGIAGGGSGSSITNGTSNVSVAASGNVTVGVAGSTVATFTTNGVQTGNIINSNANGVGNIGSSTTYFNTVFARATSAQYADLAENYAADEDYPVGTLLIIGGSNEVTTSGINYHDSRVIGTVSDKPAYTMNSGLQSKYVATVALTGRVPCRVQGPVGRGDCIVASEIPGLGCTIDLDWWQPGCIVGKALTGYDGTDEGLIEIVVGRH